MPLRPGDEPPKGDIFFPDLPATKEIFVRSSLLIII